TRSAVVNSGHILLAVYAVDGSTARRLLLDRGVEFPRLATHVERLGRVDEGGATATGVTIAVADALAAVELQGLSRDQVGPRLDRANAILWTSEMLVAHRALAAHGESPS